MQMELEGTGVRVGIVRPGPSATEQGNAWPPEVVDEVLADWGRWGIMRHAGYLRPSDVAAAVLAVVSEVVWCPANIIEMNMPVTMSAPKVDRKSTCMNSRH